MRHYNNKGVAQARFVQDTNLNVSRSWYVDYHEEGGSESSSFYITSEERKITISAKMEHRHCTDINNIVKP